jgi:UDP-N-acetylmuramate--alanine ligase
VGRRFEVKGEAGGVIVIDDYAHHPTKIRATLEAARSRYPDRSMWAIWQPHTYSRIKTLKTEFMDAFGMADHVIVLPVYAAREQDTLGVASEDLASELTHVDARYAASFEVAVATLCRHLLPGDVVITLGAGDSYRISEMLLRTLEAQGEPVDE